MATKPASNTANGGRMTQAERTALSDQRMFEASISLIIDRGTQKTTLKDIGERAGYSRGLANYRFGSKEALLNELFIHFDGLWKAHLNHYIADQVSIAAVKSALNALRDFLQLEANYMRAMYILWYESLGHESEIRTKLADHHDVYRKDATRWIQQGIDNGEIDPGVDPEQFAVQFCAFIFGIVYQWLVNADALDLDSVFDACEENMIKLLTKRG